MTRGRVLCANPSAKHEGLPPESLRSLRVERMGRMGRGGHPQGAFSYFVPSKGGPICDMLMKNRRHAVDGLEDTGMRTKVLRWLGCASNHRSPS